MYIFNLTKPLSREQAKSVAKSLGFVITSHGYTITVGAPFGMSHMDVARDLQRALLGESPLVITCDNKAVELKWELVHSQTEHNNVKVKEIKDGIPIIDTTSSNGTIGAEDVVIDSNLGVRIESGDARKTGSGRKLTVPNKNAKR
jgi:hypothetical protein